jgi:hypothetical protein
MKPISEMNLRECILVLKYGLPIDDAKGGMVRATLSPVMQIDVAYRIHELTRWIPVSEKLPTKEDANCHDEVMVNLDPMSIVNSPFGITGIETVEYRDVCPSKHTHWKRTTEPPEGV